MTSITDINTVPKTPQGSHTRMPTSIARSNTNILIRRICTTSIGTSPAETHPSSSAAFWYFLGIAVMVFEK